jgi:hypothetical protein
LVQEFDWEAAAFDVRLENLLWICISIIIRATPACSDPEIDFKFSATFLRSTVSQSESAARRGPPPPSRSKPARGATGA